MQYSAVDGIVLRILRRDVFTHPLASKSSLKGQCSSTSFEAIGPRTTEGKWLALLLALRRATRIDDRIAPELGFYKSIGVSKRRGPHAIADLQSCGWITNRRFTPGIRSGSAVHRHALAIIKVLTFDSAFTDRLKLITGQTFKPDNALLLATLLELADDGGRVYPAAAKRLAALTGFNANDQLKTQMKRLQELGFVSRVIPGVFSSKLFGNAKSCIYLNLLHPCWDGIYSGYKAIPIHLKAWPDFNRDECVLRRHTEAAAMEEMAVRPEIAAYFRNFVMTLISRMMSMHRTQAWENRTLSVDIRKAFQRYEIPESDLVWFLRTLWGIAVRLRDKIYFDNDVTLEQQEGQEWSFTVIPGDVNWGAGETSSIATPLVVVVSNCPYLSRAIDVSWFATRRINEWIPVGLFGHGTSTPK